MRPLRKTQYFHLPQLIVRQRLVEGSGGRAVSSGHVVHGCRPPELDVPPLPPVVEHVERPFLRLCADSQQVRKTVAINNEACLQHRFYRLFVRCQLQRSVQGLPPWYHRKATPATDEAGPIVTYFIWLGGRDIWSALAE